MDEENIVVIQPTYAKRSASRRASRIASKRRLSQLEKGFKTRFAVSDTIPEYNALQDKSLTPYFEEPHVKKQLKTLGLIRKPRQGWRTNKSHKRPKKTRKQSPLPALGTSRPRRMRTVSPYTHRSRSAGMVRIPKDSPVQSSEKNSMPLPAMMEPQRGVRTKRATSVLLQTLNQTGMSLPDISEGNTRGKRRGARSASSMAVISDMPRQQRQQESPSRKGGAKSSFSQYQPDSSSRPHDRTLPHTVTRSPQKQARSPPRANPKPARTTPSKPRPSPVSSKATKDHIPPTHSHTPSPVTARSPVSPLSADVIHPKPRPLSSKQQSPEEHMIGAVRRADPREPQPVPVMGGDSSAMSLHLIPSTPNLRTEFSEQGAPPGSSDVRRSSPAVVPPVPNDTGAGTDSSQSAIKRKPRSIERSAKLPHHKRDEELRKQTGSLEDETEESHGHLGIIRTDSSPEAEFATLASYSMADATIGEGMGATPHEEEPATASRRSDSSSPGLFDNIKEAVKDALSDSETESGVITPDSSTDRSRIRNPSRPDVGPTVHAVPTVPEEYDADFEDSQSSFKPAVEDSSQDIDLAAYDVDFSDPNDLAALGDGPLH
eukprot:gnl/Dysnectes_brevis/3705_a4746_475.p1 GENE.gnl/Dysnectes_brevis/3705_a4746_475~~gnl/Dysnectes_brevis/3705_a4746_475.p1  ORF type:complete len:601 (-),score=153.91 gnl/Dysnectes_brevis/3705_a4746_475:82-1884(-)